MVSKAGVALMIIGGVGLTVAYLVTRPRLSVSFTYSPANPRVGQRVDFYVSVALLGGVGPYTYYWYRDGVLGVSGLDLWTMGMIFDSPGIHSVGVKVTDSQGLSGSYTAWVTVSP